jgi:type II secretion system protein N
MKKRIVYPGYIIIVTVFFLYYLFPGDAVTAYINYQINNMSPDVQLSIKDLKPSFPPGMKLVSPNLLNRNQPLIGAEFLDIRPSYLSLFKKDKTFFINGDIYDGMLDSSVSIASISADPEYDFDLTFDRIQISKIPIMKEYEAYQFSGLIAGNLLYSNKEVKAGKGSAGFIITESAVKFTPALFGLDQLDFKTINADFDILNQRVTLKKLDVDSRDVSANATGSIILRNPIDKSTMSIQGEIKLHPSFLKQLGSVFPLELIPKQRSKTGGIPFRITGSIERPNFAFK